MCGSTGGRGRPDQPPIAAGGRIGEWVGGSYAAAAAAAVAWSGTPTHVDLSLLECMCVTMNTYSPVFASFLNWRRAPGPPRTIEIPSIEPTSDGYVGFCTITAQQFRDFLVLIERPDLVGDKTLATPAHRMRRMGEVLEIIHTWTTKRTTAEAIEAASLLRIPVAPIGNGETVRSMGHFEERGVFVANPDGDFFQPRVPYQVSGVETRTFEAAPALGQHSGSVRWTPRGSRSWDDETDAVRWTPRGSPSRSDETGAAGEAGSSRSPRGQGGAPGSQLPLEGIRIVDFTAFWAGPAATHMLAALGAEVIKIESVRRPDGMRLTSTAPPSVDRWWEWGPVFFGANSNKRSVTLDMTRTEGLALAKRLIAAADAVMENFTPRVMEGFGLGWDQVHEVNPMAVMVRMPAFGLSGPWRDRTGFAQTMEQVSGMAWVTGWPDGPPILPRGVCDPMAGMHAVVALVAALSEARASGEGRLVEVTMVEAALNAAAEQIVEHSAYGALLSRRGNRGHGVAPQGLYPCAGDERWLALSVETDEHWTGLREALGDPEWAGDESLATWTGREKAHDRIDGEICRWCSVRELEEVVELLAKLGVPAAAVTAPTDIGSNPQLKARGLLEELHHPVVGTHRVPGIPFNFVGRERGWLRSPPPTLGQHNEEVLGGLLTPSEIERLRATQVIGERLVSS